MLGIYAWRRRYVPAALPFALFCLFAGLWTLGHGFELMAVTPARQLFWAQFLTAAKVTPLEFTIGGGDSARHTTAQATPLYDGRGPTAGPAARSGHAARARTAGPRAPRQRRADVGLRQPASPGHPPQRPRRRQRRG